MLGKSGSEIKSIRFKYLNISEPWTGLFGDLAEGAQVIVSGFQGCGKSTLALQLALDLAQMGRRVLYLALEEGYSATLQQRIKRFGSHENLRFMDMDDAADAKRRNPNLFGLYDDVFVDSIQMIEGFNEIEIRELKKKFPKTNFYYISQVSKSGSVRGSNKIGHECDVIIRAELEVITNRKSGEKTQKRVATCTKSRFGECGTIPIKMKK